MELKRTVCRRILILTAIFMFVLLLLVDSAIYLGLIAFSEKVSFLSQSYPKIPEIKNLSDQIEAIRNNFRFYGLPVSAVIFAALGFLFCLLSRFFIVKLINYSGFAVGKKPGTPLMKTEFDRKGEENNDRRIFLHLLSVLQREGRLLDFFLEDLSEYEDSQVGVAVRNIHENCKKVIDKYVDLNAVANEMEGESMTVGPNFDSSAVKLTGNVTGEPPFRGIVRHRGWQVARLRMPTLSGSGNPNIIAPAEVEIP